MALELATGPTPAMVVAGLVMGTKGAVVEVPEGAEVIEASPVVEGARPDVVEAGEAVCKPLADAEDRTPELEGPGMTPEPDELADKLSGQ